jgi:hypothetical protein
MLAFINTVAASKGITLGTKAGVEPYKLYDIVQVSSSRQLGDGTMP